MTKTKVRYLQLAVAAAALFVFAAIVQVTVAAPQPKVDICHIPPGNPDNYHTITVSSNALPAHLAHGDLGGACNDLCATLCDDGDACTIDDSGDCESAGCPGDPRTPTDCDDGARCTSDSCDSATGCANDPVVCNAPDLCTVSACAPDTGECVDSPITCPLGQECNPDNGQCADSGPSCDSDWQCGQPLPICGTGGVGNICICDQDIPNGNDFCWANFPCSDPNANACTSNSDCISGWTCNTTCCGQTCTPPCPNPSGVGAETFTTESLPLSSEPTAAGN